jgi:hypothetical protein
MSQQAVSADIISKFCCWNIFPKNIRNTDRVYCTVQLGSGKHRRKSWFGLEKLKEN